MDSPSETTLRIAGLLCLQHALLGIFWFSFLFCSHSLWLEIFIRLVLLAVSNLHSLDRFLAIIPQLVISTRLKAPSPLYDDSIPGMANRQLTRRILLSIFLAIFFIFILFSRPEGPPSPAVRAPGHIDKSTPKGPISKEILKGEVVMPHLGNETAKYAWI